MMSVDDNMGTKIVENLRACKCRFHHTKNTIRRIFRSSGSLCVFNKNYKLVVMKM